MRQERQSSNIDEPYIKCTMNIFKTVFNGGALKINFTLYKQEL